MHEGNLLTLDVTHKGGDATDVGLLIQSTDGAQAAYVSPAYRNAVVNTDGDLDEWFGNVKNPSDDAMPGVMSTDGAGEDFMVTWDANNLYIALTGVDMGAADLQIYIDSTQVEIQWVRVGTYLTHYHSLQTSCSGQRMVQ